VGRLLEVQVDCGYRTIADVDQLFDAIDAQVGKLAPSQKIVTVADWRRISIMSPDASERLRHRMALLNPRTQRSAALVPSEAPVAVLQFVRVVREANFHDRKIFSAVQELTSWLQEVLSREETQRLREFLVGPTRSMFPQR
jgi:glutathione S-transferase